MLYAAWQMSWKNGRSWKMRACYFRIQVFKVSVWIVGLWLLRQTPETVGNLKHRHVRRARVIFCDLKSPGGSSTQLTLKSYNKGHSFTYTGPRLPKFNVIIEFNFLVQTLMIVVPKYLATILQNNTFPSFPTKYLKRTCSFRILLGIRYKV